MIPKTYNVKEVTLVESYRKVHLTKPKRKADAIVAFLLAFVVTFVSIVGVLVSPFISGANAGEDPVPAPSKCHWDLSGRMYPIGQVNLRTLRMDNGLAYMLAEDSGHVSIINYRNWDKTGITSWKVMPGTNIRPYDVRSYKAANGEHYIFIGLRNTSQVYEYHIANYDSASPTLDPIGPINIGGTGPVKMIIDQDRGILYTPNEKTDNVSVININDPLHPHVDALLGLAHGSTPSRVTLIPNDDPNKKDVIAVYNMNDNGSVSFFQVDKSADGVFGGKTIGTVLTGKLPYFGDGNTKALFVSNSGGNTVSDIDISDPYHPHLITNIITGDSPLIPKLITSPDGKQNTIVVTNQGFADPTTGNRPYGSVTSIDITDYLNPKVVGNKLRAGIGAGNLETPTYAGNRTMVTVDSPGGTLTWFDMTNPQSLEYIATTFINFKGPGEPHYAKFTDDGHHMIITDRKQNWVWLLKETCDAR